MSDIMLNQLTFGFTDENAVLAASIALAVKEKPLTGSVLDLSPVTVKAETPVATEDSPDAAIEPAASAIAQTVEEDVESEPCDELAEAPLKGIVRCAARAYGNDWEDGKECDGTEWEYLLDDNGRLISPGRAEDRLADFIITSINRVYDEGFGEDKLTSALGETFMLAADILGRCFDRIDALRCTEENSEDDEPIALRIIVQAAAAGYTKAGKNSWNQLINEDGCFEAQDDFDDLLAVFVLRELGTTYEAHECAEAQIRNASNAMELAQSRLRRVATSLAYFDFAR